MTINVVAIFRAKEGSEETVEQHFRSVIEPTHAEAGCIHYQLNRDADDPRRFVWIETWQSRDILEQHLKTDHIQTLFSALPQYIESEEIIILDPLAGGAA